MGADPQLLTEVPLFSLLDEKERATLAERLETRCVRRRASAISARRPGRFAVRRALRRGRDLLQERHRRAHRARDRARRRFLRRDLAARRRRRARPPPSRPKTSTPSSSTARTSTSSFALQPARRDGACSPRPAAACARPRKLRHTVSRNINEETEDKRTKVMKVADWISEFSGSLDVLVHPPRPVLRLDRAQLGPLAAMLRQLRSVPVRPA